MLISHRFQFIYTKTVKTASTSVESYFERFCMPEGEWQQTHAREEYESADGVIGYRGSDPGKKKWRNHMAASAIRKQIGRKTWDRYFKFCVIRNPWDKCISAYEHFVVHAGREVALPKHAKLAGMTEEQARFLAYLRSSPPIDRDKYLIGRTFCLDDVIRYEQLESDIERICQLLALPFEPAYLPRFKSGLRRPESSVESLYSELAFREVEKLFDFEIHKFGYTRPSC